MSKSKEGDAYKDEIREDGKRDVQFNRGPEDGGSHGHVVTSPDNSETYHARDVDGNVYVNKESDSSDQSK